MARTKGAHVINAVKVLRQDRERARRVLPPALHRYLEERIMPSSWYPLDDHLVLLHAVAELFMPPGVDPWVTMGQGTARMDMAGIYKLHLRPGEPGRTLFAMSAVWRSVHDSGEVIAHNAGPQSFSMTILGYHVRAREICGIAQGYLGEVVRIAGGRDPRVEHTRCCCDGARDCTFAVTWR
jgi:uncharacterized protein (TIGR02265 family)